MKNIVILFIGALAFLGCKDPEPTDPPITTGNVKVEVKATFNGEPLDMSSVYVDHLGHRIRVEYLLAYLSNVRLVDTSGDETVLSKIFLAEMLSGTKSFSKAVEANNFAEIKFGIGVPEEDNVDNDPSLYANNHPLSAIGAQGMFWTWNSGYIFVKFEGKADLEGEEGNELLSPYAFHCGADSFYQDHSFELSGFSLKATETKTISIVFEVDKFLNSAEDSINIEEDFLTHTSGNVELAERFMNIFNEAIHIEY